MRYQAILLDVDGTMVNSERIVVESLAAALKELCLPAPDDRLKELAMYGTSRQVMDALCLPDPDAGLRCWNRHWVEMLALSQLYPGMEDVLRTLLQSGVRLGVVTSRTRYEFDTDPTLRPLRPYFSVCVCEEDVKHIKPDPEPIQTALESLGVRPEDALYVGDSPSDGQSARAAGVDFALALWGCRPGARIPAKYALARPDDLVTLTEERETRWLDWARELQFIAQAGLTYSKDPFDLERFQRVRELSAEMMQAGTGMDITQIRDLFCSETGFQTPKLDTRAALFDGDRILLVQERNGLWSLPGGWVDVNQSVGQNALKELREEAGIDAELVKLIALQDRNRHNRPIYAYGICKAFVLCRALSGSFQPNAETTRSAYFSENGLPPLDEAKNTAAQIRMCFAARRGDWTPIVD